jgi:sulfur-oxidizing protein SoxY
MMHAITRRTGLLWSALAAWGILKPISARAEVLNVSQAELVAMKLSSDGITLDFPSLADTGAAIPLQVIVVAPRGTRIETIEVFLPENPNTRALKLKMPEPPEKFDFTTRLRLAGSQDVWVVVTYSDGSQRGSSAPTVVTSSACFDAS